jgi:predicted membrane-bound dolichyl-phosphate-mannose-protein mannosyltransferase
MKAAKLLSAWMLLLGMMAACSEQKVQNTEVVTIENEGSVEVYYFHNARRCATCEAVETQSKTALQEMYGNDVKMFVFDLEDKEGAGKAEALDVSGQTLLVVSGSTKIDLTNEAFLYARTNPEKLKQTLKENIDPLL